jgi:patatin-like phospholipase/acyl hydrolase
MKDVSRRQAIGLGAVAVTSAMLPKLAAAANSDSSIDFRPKYKILSFCGGGIRGLASVTMLNVLYQKFPNIISETDALAGYSTGK